MHVGLAGGKGILEGPFDCIYPCKLYTGTCTILQETINGFLCRLVVFLKSKTYQLNFEGRE